MEHSKLFLIPCFLFCTIMAKREEYCLPTSAFMCSTTDGPIIQFPFSLSPSCAYPGFNISCDKMNSAVIQVGSWGEFSVRDVNYFSQEVQIRDQHNCLPKRLLNLDLSGSPFKAARYENFTFFNCTSEFTSNNSTPISCLSSLNHTAYATSALDTETEMIRNCDLITSVMVPSRSRRYQTDVNNNMHIHLTWDTPDCRACARQYGNCGFKNRDSNEISCFSPLPKPPKHGLSTGAKYGIVIGVGIPAVICLILIARRSTHQTHVESSSSVMQERPIIFMVGLDESTIQSYPRTVLGESGQLVNLEGSACSICLSEYRSRETLKTIPECKHCFHATCIDEWLRENATCPVCRYCLTALPSTSSG